MTRPELSGRAVCTPVDRVRPPSVVPAYNPAVDSKGRRGASMSIGMFRRPPSVGPKVQRRGDAVVGPACSAASGPVPGA